MVAALAALDALADAAAQESTTPAGGDGGPVAELTGRKRDSPEDGFETTAPAQQGRALMTINSAPAPPPLFEVEVTESALLAQHGNIGCVHTARGMLAYAGFAHDTEHADVTLVTEPAGQLFTIGIR